eukprot:108456-Hanusia_phi.AAC.1
MHTLGTQHASHAHRPRLLVPKAMVAAEQPAVQRVAVVLEGDAELLHLAALLVAAHAARPAHAPVPRAVVEEGLGLKGFFRFLRRLVFFLCRL